MVGRNEGIDEAAPCRRRWTMGAHLGSLGGVKAGHLLKGRQPGQIGEAEGGSEQKSAITDREDHMFG